MAARGIWQGGGGWHDASVQSRRPSRAWSETSIEAFATVTTEEILGTLATNSGFDVERLQLDAWSAQIDFLRERLHGLTGAMFFEFSIPRMGRRIDVVLLIGGVVFALEFKTGETAYDSAAIDQVWDYALDLKNFHEASHDLTLVPLLVVPDGPDVSDSVRRDADGVVRPLRTNRKHVRDVIDRVMALFAAMPIDAERWATASYRPTPTIVEAARALYAQHSVEEIARHDAGAETCA
jgi:hypothetical protein